MTKMSRRIVVDASVARSAGSTENPTSQHCREFLDVMRKICHKVVMTPEIESEWRKHRSRYSTSWLAAMQSRGKIVRVTPGEDLSQPLTAQLAAADLPSSKQRAIAKDLCFVVAALAGDRIVASRDDRMRTALAELSAIVTEIQNIVWVNPAGPGETAIQWLEQGARAEPARTIRNAAKQP